MKKHKIFILVLCIVLVAIAAIGIRAYPKLNVEDSFAYTRVNESNIGPVANSYFSYYMNVNGIYSSEDSTNVRYLFLNGSNVKAGEKAAYFTDVKMSVSEKTLNIYFNENYTADYKNKELNNRVLYKIRKPKNVDTIRIYKNGQETHFDACITTK